MPKISLFIPCLVQDCFPEIGLAAASVLTRAGVQVAVPEGQTCCGQFQYKRGLADQTARLALHFMEVFEGADAVVAPSGSCVKMVRNYPGLFPPGSPERARAKAMAARTFEFCQYLVDELGVTDLGARFEARAAYHDSCQVGRGLGIHAQPRALLAAVQGLTMLPLADEDRCCGFGGAFSMEFPEVSEAVLEDKAKSVLASGAEVLVTAEPSCMMNLRGYFERAGHPVRVLHLAQILAGEEGRS